jgi:sporulation protein YlmC with PRC-barrel domain
MDQVNYSNLVSSADVDGTEVYSPNGDHVGSIDHVMIDKKSGKIAYAVMGFGGFLGMGQDHHPIPWSSLRYDTNLNGYVTDITLERLQGAPERRDDWYRDREWEQRTYDYYGAPYYWI